ncbi:transmembrane and immunoglobulin domain-containing protein 2 [Emydura macquarii macquarii]|uniref:transmembrane and immunoglobulin domain-containing protein 2 n=1 Tax=Emydura macquarii macquarii TaxID=1129001 RepID=UPI00352B5168
MRVVKPILGRHFEIPGGSVSILLYLVRFLSPVSSHSSFLLAAKEEAGTLQVWQFPAQIQAPLGGSVELHCRIDVAQHWERLRVEWWHSTSGPLCQVLLNNASVSNCCRGVEDCDTHPRFSWDPPNFTLRMDNFREGDVGLYECVATVEIPVHLEARGNGTMLNASGPEFWLGLAGVLAVVVLLVAVTVICCYKCRCRDPGQMAIYVNVLYRKKEAAKKGDAQANDEKKHNSIYNLEFERRGHSRKPPVPERSPGPTKASR